MYVKFALVKFNHDYDLYTSLPCKTDITIIWTVSSLIGCNNIIISNILQLHAVHLNSINGNFDLWPMFVESDGVIRHWKK